MFWEFCCNPEGAGDESHQNTPPAFAAPSGSRPPPSALTVMEQFSGTFWGEFSQVQAPVGPTHRLKGGNTTLCIGVIPR
eukprot:58384-Pyramimonas_sp.AAC.1